MLEFEMNKLLQANNADRSSYMTIRFKQKMYLCIKKYRSLQHFLLLNFSLWWPKTNKLHVHTLQCLRRPPPYKLYDRLCRTGWCISSHSRCTSPEGLVWWWMRRRRCYEVEISLPGSALERQICGPKFIRQTFTAGGQRFCSFCKTKTA